VPRSLTPNSAHLKLNRAGEHIETVNKLVEDWLRTDAYTISREKDPETGDTVRRAQIQCDPPPFISIVVGDAVENLRSALDHTVYSLAASASETALSLEVQEALMFPIVGNQNSKGQPADGSKIYPRIASQRLIGIPDDARAFIESEQPYHWGDGYRYHWLWSLHELSRIDKHRRLALTTAFLDFQFVSTPEGIKQPRIRFERAEGPVDNDDVLVTYSGADEGVDAHFTRDVAFDEGVMTTSTISSILRNVQMRVFWVVSMLERFL
jgi:hypothetical protein